MLKQVPFLLLILYIPISQVEGQQQCVNLSHPTISNDGTKMLFVSDKYGSNDIYLLNFESKKIRRLTTSNSQESRPGWFPDDTGIIFDSDMDGDYEIYSMLLNNSDLKQLTFNTKTDMFGTVSPDGEEVVFFSDRGENREIYKMNLDGSQQVNLTQHTSRDGVPYWSPNGKKILFHSTRTGELHFQLYEMDTDGKNQQQISFSEASEELASYSPKGNYIAYYREHIKRKKIAELYLFNIQNRVSWQLTSHEDFRKIGEYAPPSWFPDGKRIAFWAIDNTSPCSQLYSLDVKSKKFQKINVRWDNYEN